MTDNCNLSPLLGEILCRHRLCQMPGSSERIHLLLDRNDGGGLMCTEVCGGLYWVRVWILQKKRGVGLAKLIYVRSDIRQLAWLPNGYCFAYYI